MFQSIELENYKLDELNDLFEELEFDEKIDELAEIRYFEEKNKNIKEK